MSGLLAGVALAALLLLYVFYRRDDGSAAPRKTRVTFLHERKEAIYENLRDLNFEYKAGKYPEADYIAMKAALEDEAAAVLAEIESHQPVKSSI